MSQVRAWLTSPAALLFKRVLKARVTAAALVAGTTLAQNPDDEHNKDKADRAAREAEHYLSAYEVLEVGAQEAAADFDKAPSLPLETITITT